MDREDVVLFIRKEAKRLREEEHIDDLIKSKRWDELSKVACQTVKGVTDYVCDYSLELQDDEIPEGACSAMAIWFASCAIDDNTYLLEDVESFAHRWASEAGSFGKNGAVQILDGNEFFEICSEDFYTDKFAEEYDEKYPAVDE